MSTRASRQTNNETRIIKFQKKNTRDLIESLRVGAGSESARGIGGAGSESEGGGSPSTIPNVAKIKELGDITSPLIINFNVHDDRSLTGNIDGDTVITFANIPTLLLTTLRLYIRSTNPIITIGGTIVSGVGSSPLITTAVDDFLDITFWSVDQVNIIIGTVKKNDKTEEAPNSPTIVSATPESTTEIDLFWQPPTIGTLPIKYDVAWSLSNAGSAANGPDTPAPGSPDIDLTDVNHIVTGLTVDTTYFFWIKAHNDVGNSDYAGPIEAKTLGAPTFVLSAVGRKLRFNVTFPKDITLAEIDYALDSGFTDKLVTKSFPRPLGNWSVPSSHDFDTDELTAETQFFGRVRFKKVQELGPYAATQNVTTGTLLVCSAPTLTVTSPATGQVRIKVKHNDSPTRDEIAVCTWRLASSVQEYFDTIYEVGTTNIQNAYSRNQPPNDDLNPLENRLEVIRDGAWSPGDNITIRCVLVNAAGTSISDTENVIIDS